MADLHSKGALRAVRGGPAAALVKRVRQLLLAKLSGKDPNRSQEPEAEYALRLLRSKFERFAGAGSGGLGREAFAALLLRHGCCGPEACNGFFAACLADANRRLGSHPGEGDFQAGSSEPQALSFLDFAMGVCVAEPQDSLPLQDKARFLAAFFATAPRQNCVFRTSLIQGRWPHLRGVFLAAYRGAPHFTCLHELYSKQPEVFRLVVEFILPLAP